MKMLFAIFSAIACVSASLCAGTHVDASGVWRWNADGREVRIWGVNYYPPFAVDHHVIRQNGWDVRKIIDEDLADMALLGVTGIRLHAFDREISREDGSLIDNDHMEALDYLIAEAGKRGMHVVLTPVAWWGDKIKNRERSFSDNYRMIDLTYKRDEAWPILVRYLKEFCSHVNRYTGKRYADDPAVIAFESVNEPLYHRKTKPGGFDLPDSTVLDFINTMTDAIRSTGTRKPVFYCAWHGKNAVCAKSRIDGITGSAYPFARIVGGTSANSRTELKGEYLRFIRNSTLVETNSAANAAVANKAKMIYEFNPSSYANAAGYPVFAKMFRQEGAQAAFLFVYDFKMGADRNRSWPGQYFNAAYTPREAVSFAIAGEVMKHWNSTSPFLPVANECAFGPFFVNESKNLSKMDGHGIYAFAGTTVIPPKRPERVRKVMGCGKSPFVSSSGTGAFFMDKMEDGMWKLTLLPDVEHVANPYAAGNSLKRRLHHRSVTMTFAIPDLGNEFVVIGSDRREVCRADKKGSIVIKPGTYRLQASKAPRFAFQVYAVRDLCEKDFPGTLKAVKALGYEGVETGRFYGRSAKEIRSLMEEVGLKLVALQLYPDDLVEPKLRETLRFTKECGTDRINVAWFKGSSENHRDWQLLVDVVNHAAAVAAKEGITIGYHNHDQEFLVKFNGKYVWDWLWERFSPLVKQEFDAGWCALAGVDPHKVLRRYPNRNPTVHVMPAIADAAGLEPGVAGVASVRDKVNWKKLLAEFAADGTQWFVVKPVIFPDSIEDLKASIEYLKKDDK